MNDQLLTPRQIVHELDRFIVGQDDAKKAVLEKYGAELTQDELETFYGKKLTKEDMEMLAAGNAYQAFYCCAWN